MVAGLLATHRWSGYAVAVLLLVAAMIAANRGRSGREFESGLFRFSAVVLDLQVLLGLLVYGVDQYWEHDEALVAYVHPALMLVALAVAHIGVARARREQMAADAYRIVNRSFATALVLIAAGIGAALAG